jgi:hypothetical protein
MKKHYVYRSFEEGGREYIGCRTCDCLPEEDTKYFGSFYDKTFKPTEKTILFVCETREEILEIEIELHDFFDVAVNPQFANRAKATSTKFDRTGVSKTEAQKKAMSGENNPMFGRSGENHPLFGVPKTKEWKKTQSEKMSGEKHPNYGRTGALHPQSKAIIAIEPDGTERHFVSLTEAAKELEIGLGNLSGRYLKPGYVPRGKWEGWQFLFKNSEDR